MLIRIKQGGDRTSRESFRSITTCDFGSPVTFKEQGMSWFTTLVIIGALATTCQAISGCKNCINLGKEEKAMFKAHSAACMSQSKVSLDVIEMLLNGELMDSPALRKHVYCVLLKCKIIGKDGKLHKSSLFSKIGTRNDGKNITKVLLNCADQMEVDVPEDMAWNLFRCGYVKKAVLFNYMPLHEARDIPDTDI